MSPTRFLLKDCTLRVQNGLRIEDNAEAGGSLDPGLATVGMA